MSDYPDRLFPHSNLRWLMSSAERAALLRVLEVAEAPGAIEVGTAYGGCLEQIRRHAEFVYSIDLLPEIGARLASGMPNVEFLAGDSKDLIGVALRKCVERRKPPGFILIDGDHRYEGVRSDINAVLQFRPERPLWVLMHDSSNPECRAGIADAAWQSNPCVHSVELDFVMGTLSDDPDFVNMIWGGLAIALLLPEPRQGALKINASGARSQAALYRLSDHYPSLANRLRRWWRVKKKGLDRRLARLKGPPRRQSQP